MSEQRKKIVSDFDYIYYPDGTCGVCDSRKSGVVLAYDEFSPEGATWFCDDCWEDLGIVQPMFMIVEDRRRNMKEQIQDMFRVTPEMLGELKDTNR